MPELPVKSLSLSGARTLRQCSERWRRRYIEREYEPSSGPMVLGKAAGAAEAQSDHHWIDRGEPLDTKQVEDAYSDEFDLAAGEDVDWREDRPGEIKDQGAAALRDYHENVVPVMSKPVDAEREVRFEVEAEDGSDVPFVAYLDVETEDGIVIDRKMTKSRWSQQKADDDAQPTSYLAGRRAEGNPASGFTFHPMVRGVKKPYAQEPIETDRTDEQLDHFLLDVLGTADEIAWRVETDSWSYAPDGAWWCSEKFCGYWASCPGGGLYRTRAAKAGRNGGGA